MNLHESTYGMAWYVRVLSFHRKPKKHVYQLSMNSGYNDNHM